MKSLSYVFGHTTHTTVSGVNNISLHGLVDRLMESLLPLAVAKHSFIINDVEAGTHVEADEQVLAYLVGNMMINVINSSKNACVRIEALRKPGGIQLRICNNGNFYYSAVFGDFASVAA